MIGNQRIGELWGRLFKHETDNTLVKLFRYLMAGGTAFVVDFFTLVILTEFAGIPYLVSAAIAFSLGLFVIYFLTIAWVFRAGQSPGREIFIFMFTGVTGLLLNELILYICVDFLAIHYSISKLISAGLVFFWNFFSRNTLLGIGERHK
jgi:putative flippase GtrA